MTHHQQKQIKVINRLEELVRQKSDLVSAVTATEDFENDTRICLTSVHFLKDSLKENLQPIIQSLKELFPELHFYSNKSLHITVKNVRVISDPPTFNSDDIINAEKAFSTVVPKHKQYKVYFYRLLLTQNSIALVGTTDDKLDKIIFDLDKQLKEVGIPDNKKYANSKYFFCNITLARFSQQITKEMEEKVKEISDKMTLDPYVVDSVNLISSNALLNHLQIHGTWELGS